MYASKRMPRKCYERDEEKDDRNKKMKKKNRIK